MPLLPILSSPSPADSNPPATFFTPLPPLTPLALFNPSEELTDQLLRNRTDPVHTLADIAAQANLSLQDLLRWFESPEIAARIARARACITAINQELAATTLHMGLKVLGCVLRTCSHILGHLPVASADQKGHELTRRVSETALRAAALLHRIGQGKSTPQRTAKLTEKIGRHFAQHLIRKDPTAAPTTAQSAAHPAS